MGGTISSAISRSSARSPNSAATARASSPSSTASERSGTEASRRERSSSSPARLESRSSSRRAVATWRWASAMSSCPSRRSSSSSSIVPWSIVSGVRSSCEAVATNERRADSWRRSSSCMRPNARARSPTSSRPSSRCSETVGALRGDPQRGRAQPAEPAQQRAGQRDGERDRDEQPDAGGREQRVAHLRRRRWRPRSGGARRRARRRRRRCGTAARRSHDVAADVEHGLLAVIVRTRGEERLARRRAASESAGSPGATRVVGRGQREVVDEHAPGGLVGAARTPAAERDLAIHLALAPAPPRSAAARPAPRRAGCRRSGRAGAAGAG